MKQNDEHQDEGQKSICWRLSVVSMVALFLSTSGRLRWPSLASNVLYVICKYPKIRVGIAIIRGSVLPLNGCRVKAS